MHAFVFVGDLEDLLRFLVTDAFEPPAPSDDASGAPAVPADDEHAFQVRALADQYQLPGLVALAEARLGRTLSRENVLSHLGRVFVGARDGSKGALERACWELLDEDGHTILKEKRKAREAKAAVTKGKKDGG